jgi:hypothetical protein
MDIDGFVFGAFDEMVFYTSAFDDTASCRTYQQYFRVAPGHRTLTEKPTVNDRSFGAWLRGKISPASHFPLMLGSPLKDVPLSGPVGPSL